MTTVQVGKFLGVSPRTVGRHAKELGGHMVAGRLVFDAAAVREHREGMTE